MEINRDSRREDLESDIFNLRKIDIVHLQIYVGIERARLIKRLSEIKEEQGQVDEAVDLMQVVETFGSMAKTEEIAFILEQQRMDEDGLRPKQHVKKLRLDARAAKVQAGFGIEKTSCTKQRRTRSGRLV